MRYGSGFASVTSAINTPAVGTAKIIWRTKRGVSPACTPSIRQQYASVPYAPPIRRRHSFEWFLLLIYKALDIQYIEACSSCVHTNQFPFHLCRLVLFQPSAAWITLMNNRNCMLQTCCRNKTNYVCPQKQRTIEAVENRFLLCIHNGLHVANYTEGSNFGLK